MDAVRLVGSHPAPQRVNGRIPRCGNAITARPGASCGLSKDSEHPPAIAAASALPTGRAGFDGYRLGGQRSIPKRSCLAEPIADFCGGTHLAPHYRGCSEHLLNW
jgi:hypothetical protein